jgi:hypothetical protein
MTFCITTPTALKGHKVAHHNDKRLWRNPARTGESRSGDEGRQLALLASSVREGGTSFS